MKRGVGLPHRRRRRGFPGIACAVLVSATVISIAPNTGVAATDVAGDFNGDGYADLVLGVAGEDVGSEVDAGAVTIVYGDSTGVNPSNSVGFSQAGSVAGSAEAGDQFGRAFGVGDFNNDGRSDLLVGAPNEALGDLQAAGGVTALYGSSSGLRSTGTVGFSQSGSIAGAPETGDRFGSAIAIGDVNGDGRDDAIVGAPGEDEGSVVDSGIVHLIYGSGSGLAVSGNKIYSQAGATAGSVERDDRFGSALALGDFDGDGNLDLAVGAPGEDIGSLLDAGAVIILYGNGSGFTSTGSQLFSQSGAISGAAETGDAFGKAVTTGDYNGDGYDDLAVGAPGEAVGSLSGAGVVHVIYGSSNGLTTSGNISYSQGSVSSGSTEADDRFGSSLGTGDFDNDGRDDLAIGVPGEDIGSTTDAGMVNIVYGTSAGANGSKTWAFSQNGSISGSVEAHDLVGSSITIADLNGDGYDDVITGAPGEDIGSATDAGTANIVYGSSSGLRTTGNEAISQSGVVVGAAESGDALGVSEPETWLDRVNLYRTQAGLDPVSELSSLTEGAVLHSKYMVLNGTVTHSENSSLPGYTAEGNAAGGQSNVYGTTWAATSDITAVDGWVTGPFHAIGFLTPTLTEVGYGSYRDPGASYIRMAASLDVWGAQRDWGASAGGSYSWPGDGSVVPVRAHVNEYPSPTTTCPGHQGLPVMAFFTSKPSVSNTTFTLDGDAVSHCVFDGSNYVNSDGSAQSLGRAILNSANAVVLMPSAKLTPGEEYCFSATSGSETVNTCFTVDPNA